MHIAWEKSVYVGKVPVFCAVCGHKAIPTRAKNNQFLIAVLYSSKRMAYGEVCRTCIASGADGIKQRLRERITKLELKLQELKEIDAAEVQVPSLAQEFKAFTPWTDSDRPID